jgi:hypothetical protein
MPKYGGFITGNCSRKKLYCAAADTVSSLYSYLFCQVFRAAFLSRFQALLQSAQQRYAQNIS